ncbi:hypothetical protein Cgig2_019813 [Carnegiea gigantea]|uniref:Uncharacterized protein n=1 Tax=Carnegiea gigantea TaxID=171969 RepID=A0A9Q1GHL2_9CARY|nr:hypothetical protein Cgig2_019813 [Carnegiea gigantea]
MQQSGKRQGNEEHMYFYMGESNRPKRQNRRALMTERGGCIGDHPRSRLRLGGEIIELSDDDEISVASDAKTHLWAHDYVNLIYMGVTQQLIYNQLVHPMETHNMGKVDRKTGRVVGGEEFDDEYDRCRLPSNNGRQPSKPPSKRRESQTQGNKSRRCSRSDEVGHMRRTCCNPYADFDASYKGDLRQYLPGIFVSDRMSEITIMAVRVINNNPLRFWWKDAHAMPLQFHIVIQTSVGQELPTRGGMPIRDLLRTVWKVYFISFPSTTVIEVMSTMPLVDPIGRCVCMCRQSSRRIHGQLRIIR